MASVTPRPAGSRPVPRGEVREWLAPQGVSTQRVSLGSPADITARASRASATVRAGVGSCTAMNCAEWAWRRAHWD